jgi:hypothetical protein
MDPAVTAIIGGAVGSVLTGLVRALGVPSEVRRHDAAVRDRDDILATWIADRDYALKRECKALRDKANLQPPPAPGLDQYGNDPHGDWTSLAERLDRSIADARGAALHQYRDENRRARLDMATMLAAEGWPHGIWRRVRKQPVPPLTAPTKATRLLDGWRKPSGTNPDRQTYPDDATQRTLDDALGSMPVTGP